MVRISMLCGLLLGACSQAQPAGGNQAGPLEQPDRPGSRCVAGRDCPDLLPAVRMRGVWVTGFERSGFVPDATEAPLYSDPSPDRIWLDFDDSSPPDPALRAELDKMRTTAAVAIEFVGRRSRSPGNYGHLGGARDMVVVERIISARILGPLRR
jgi:hypothetical protein